MNKPKLYILIGVPGSGKSSWVANQMFDWNRTVVASSDGHIERHAKSIGKTYNDVFKDYAPKAMKLMNEIKSEIKGKILEILVDNAEPVEFGQSLFLIDPL